LASVPRDAASLIPVTSPYITPIGIAIYAIKCKDAVIFSVTDHGPGLTAEQRRLAFRRFYRADPARARASGGAGLGLPISAVSPNCDLSSPIPSQREAMICYVRECIKLAHDLGSPICKIFAAWRGITLHNGLATYDDTYSYNQYGFWKRDRRGFVPAPGLAGRRA
jgi:sugar phosphate isomerase/epimerase